jgi:hypothetical protein
MHFFLAAMTPYDDGGVDALPVPENIVNIFKDNSLNKTFPWNIIVKNALHFLSSLDMAFSSSLYSAELCISTVFSIITQS